MKKRTSLVCFLIFTLCVFYISIPNTVFGQEEDTSLAAQVLEKYSELLQREDIITVLPDVLEALKAPEVQALLNPAIINAAIQTPSLLEGRVPAEFITLLEEDQEIKDFLSDVQVQELLQDPAAIDELAALLPAPPGDGTTPTPDDGTTPTPDDGTTPTPMMGRLQHRTMGQLQHPMMGRPRHQMMEQPQHRTMGQLRHQMMEPPQHPMMEPPQHPMMGQLRHWNHPNTR